MNERFEPDDDQLAYLAENPMAQQVWVLIKGRSYEEAITRERLCVFLSTAGNQVSDERARHEVSELCCGGFPICSRYESPGGYYEGNDNERKDTADKLAEKIYGIAERHAGLMGGDDGDAIAKRVAQIFNEAKAQREKEPAPGQRVMFADE